MPVLDVKSLAISPAGALRALAGLALASASIVIWEPAPADALIMGLGLAMLLLGYGRIGPVALTCGMLWIVVVVAGLAATPMSPGFSEAVRFQIVTLYLVVAAFALAAFVAVDPERNFHLLARAYLVGIVVALVMGIAGYFQLFPGAYDLFTNYGRARGTFKDPNVFGAALAPAFAYVVWVVMREPARLGQWGLPLLGLLGLGLLLSFSRGAWVAAGIAALVLVWLMGASARRRRDRTRLVMMSVAGLASLAVGIGLVLQSPAVRDLLMSRASLTQSYDVGPEGRFGGQAKAWELALENPFGIGTHSFRTDHHHEEVHNVYLTTFLNAGWVGGLAYISAVLLTLGVGLVAMLRFGRLQGPIAVATATFLGLAVEGFIIDTDHWRHFFIVMGLVWGLVDAAPPVVDAAHRAED